MDTLVFPVSDVIERAESIAQLEIIGVAADLADALEKPPRNAPALFVVTQSAGGEIKYTGSPFQQDMTDTVIFIPWVKNHGDAKAVRAEMDALLAAINLRFAGWSPPGNAFGPLTFLNSRDEFKSAQYLVRQHVFQCSWNFSAAIQP